MRWQIIQHAQQTISPQIYADWNHIKINLYNSNNTVYTQNHILGYKYSFSVLHPHYMEQKVLAYKFKLYTVWFRVQCHRKKTECWTTSEWEQFRFLDSTAEKTGMSLHFTKNQQSRAEISLREPITQQQNVYANIHENLQQANFTYLLQFR